jgi:hypothetical protein
MDLTANGLEAGESFMVEQSRDDIVPLADPEVDSRSVSRASIYLAESSGPRYVQ